MSAEDLKNIKECILKLMGGQKVETTIEPFNKVMTILTRLWTFLEIKIEGEKAFIVYWENESQICTSYDFVAMFEEIFKKYSDVLDWVGKEIDQLTDPQNRKEYVLGILQVILTN